MDSSSSLPENDKFFGLLPVPSQRKLSAIRDRQVSIASAISTATEVEDFVAKRLEIDQSELEYQTERRIQLRKLFEDHKLAKQDFNEAMAESNATSKLPQERLHVLKRQRKTVNEDFAAEGSPNNLELSYVTMLAEKFTAASERRDPSSSGVSSKDKKGRNKHQQAEFRKAILDRYAATRVEGSDEEHQVYCHISGSWRLSDEVRAAHIVPQSLGSSDLAHLLGTQEVALTDPRNGLSMAKSIEKAFDRGDFVLVPELPDEESEPLRWKVVLTSERLRHLSAFTGLKWKELDGSFVKFLTDKRPAKRYLYLRFAITYLICKREGNIGWVDKVTATGVIWASPGPYVRRSTFQRVARVISDYRLPHSQWGHTWFEDAPGDATRPDEEEEGVALSVGRSVMHEMGSKRARERDDEEDEDSGKNAE